MSRREPLRELLREALPEQDAATNKEVAALSGTQLRDRLIAYSPLNTPVDQASQPGTETNFLSRVTITPGAHLPLSPGHHVACCRGAESTPAVVN